MGALEAAGRVEEHMAVIAGQSYLPGLRFHQALSLAEALPSMSSPTAPRATSSSDVSAASTAPGAPARR
ncbi:MAG: hypothetical protein R3A52_06920 [Polyangiales bacterium]